MACLLYLLLKLLHGPDAFAYDTQVFCLLLALEGPGWFNAWRLWRMNRR